jgi:hypothetical protein
MRLARSSGAIRVLQKAGGEVDEKPFKVRLSSPLRLCTILLTPSYLSASNHHFLYITKRDASRFLDIWMWRLHSLGVFLGKHAGTDAASFIVLCICLFFVILLSSFVSPRAVALLGVWKRKVKSSDGLFIV